MIDKLDLIIDRIDDLKEVHADRLSSIDKNLEKHMKRTALLESRVDTLEEPTKAIKYLKSVVVGVGAIAAVAYTMLKLLPFLN